MNKIHCSLKWYLRNQNGFTLIEIVVVLVIISCLMGIGFAFVIPTRETDQLDAASNELLTVLNDTRQMALNSQTNRTVPGSGWTYAFAVELLPSGKEYKIGKFDKLATTLPSCADQDTNKGDPFLDMGFGASNDTYQLAWINDLTACANFNTINVDILGNNQTSGSDIIKTNDINLPPGVKFTTQLNGDMVNSDIYVVFANVSGDIYLYTKTGADVIEEPITGNSLVIGFSSTFVGFTSNIYVNDIYSGSASGGYGNSIQTF